MTNNVIWMVCPLYFQTETQKSSFTCYSIISNVVLSINTVGLNLNMSWSTQNLSLTPAASDNRAGNTNESHNYCPRLHRNTIRLTWWRRGAAAHPSKLRGALLSTLYMATSTSADWANQSTLQQTLKTRQTDAIACHVITPSADV